VNEFALGGGGMLLIFSSLFLLFSVVENADENAAKSGLKNSFEVLFVLSVITGVKSLNILSFSSLIVCELKSPNRSLSSSFILVVLIFFLSIVLSSLLLLDSFLFTFSFFFCYITFFITIIDIIISSYLRF